MGQATPAGVGRDLAENSGEVSYNSCLAKLPLHFAVAYALTISKMAEIKIGPYKPPIIGRTGRAAAFSRSATGKTDVSFYV
jgi:hypothetical protein